MTADRRTLDLEIEALMQLGVTHGLHEAVEWVEARFARHRTRRFRGEKVQQILLETFDDQGQVREP